MEGRLRCLAVLWGLEEDIDKACGASRVNGDLLHSAERCTNIPDLLVHCL